jgi:hypothetical protein
MSSVFIHNAKVKLKLNEIKAIKRKLKIRLNLGEA